MNACQDTNKPLFKNAMPNIFLIPTPLSEQVAGTPLSALKHLTLFVVENAKSARAALKQIIEGIDLRACELIEANEHTNEEQWQEIFKIVQGRDIGVLSEAGMPCVADPGSRLVQWAHGQGYQVKPLVGPNAIIMALAASGLSGQQFAFHGYLPRELAVRVKSIKSLEQESLHLARTQIFIEAPHHNDSLFTDLIEHCQDSTLICIATNLTAATEVVQTKPVVQWRHHERPVIHKIPTVFLMQAFLPVSMKKR